jgi:hypothetical protein
MALTGSRYSLLKTHGYKRNLTETIGRHGWTRCIYEGEFASLFLHSPTLQSVPSFPLLLCHHHESTNQLTPLLRPLPSPTVYRSRPLHYFSRNVRPLLCCPTSKLTHSLLQQMVHTPHYQTPYITPYIVHANHHGIDDSTNKCQSSLFHHPFSSPRWQRPSRPLEPFITSFPVF